jgi:hypothetical protein
MDFVLADHFRERESQLGRAHRAGHRQKHFAARVQVRGVGVRGLADYRCVEVPKMMIDELSDAHALQVRTARLSTVRMQRIVFQLRARFKKNAE